MTAEYKVHGDVAVITLMNPPVNGLGLSTRVGITDGLEKANNDTTVKAIIITGGGKAFSGGADIREFGSPKAIQEPNLLSVIRACENSAKPVVGALHSVAMGGGLELALGCHYRIAAPGTSIALPEVKLGLVPGAGGTQRLPRVIGVEPALNMIVSGEAIKSEMLAMLPGRKPARRGVGLGPQSGSGTRRWQPPADGAQFAMQAPTRRCVFSVCPQHGQGHGQKPARTCQMRGRRRSRHHQEVRRRHGL